MPTIENPLRLEILKRLTVLLEGMSTVNGYTVSPGYVGDLSGKVFRGRAIYGDTDPLPMLSLLEVPIPIDQLPPPMASGMSSGGWELMVQGFCPDDRVNPTDPAHVFVADVKKILALESKKAIYSGADSNGILGLGRQVAKIIIGPGVVRPPDEISAKAYFWLNIVLDLAEDLCEPYEV